MGKRKEDRTSEGAPTWRDYLPPNLPPPQLITRTELLAEFAAADVPITERALRHWEAVGALPRAVRQQHHGSVQAVYPRWFAVVVATVAHRREQGESLASIAADMPTFVAWNAAFFWVTENPYYSLARSPEGREIVPPLEKLMHTISTTVRPVARVVILMLDEQNKSVERYHWPPSPMGVSVGTGESEAIDSEPSVAPLELPPTDI